jgi:hypothetical protein
MGGISTKNYSPYGIACVQCDDTLIAPNWSEYVSEHHVRHSWSCDSCGYRFETSDHLRFTRTTKALREIQPLPPLARCARGSALSDYSNPV